MTNPTGGDPLPAAGQSSCCAENSANRTLGSALPSAGEQPPGTNLPKRSHAAVSRRVVISILPGNVHDGFVKQLMDDNQRPFQTREL